VIAHASQLSHSEQNVVDKRIILCHWSFRVVVKSHRRLGRKSSIFSTGNVKDDSWFFTFSFSRGCRFRRLNQWLIAGRGSKFSRAGMFIRTYMLLRDTMSDIDDLHVHINDQLYWAYITYTSNVSTLQVGSVQWVGVGGDELPAGHQWLCSPVEVAGDEKKLWRESVTLMAGLQLTPTGCIVEEGGGHVPKAQWNQSWGWGLRPCSTNGAREGMAQTNKQTNRWTLWAL